MSPSSPFKNVPDPSPASVSYYASNQLHFPLSSSAKSLMYFKAKQPAHVYPLEPVQKPIYPSQEQDAKDSMVWNDIAKEEEAILDIIVHHNRQCVDHPSGPNCSVIL